MERDCLDCPNSDECNALLTGVCTQMNEPIELTNTETKCNEFNTLLDECIQKLKFMRQYHKDITVQSIRDTQSEIVGVCQDIKRKLYSKAMELYDTYTAELEKYVRQNEQ